MRSTELQKTTLMQVDEKALVEAAIQGMLQSLDPHSGFFTVDAFEDVTEELQGTFGGIGIQISMEEGAVLVIAPIDGTPGAKAGLMPQDLITNIDGEPVQGKTLQEAVDRMRGPIGTEVTLTVLRRRTGDIFDVTVTRGVIPEQSVRGFRVNDSIGYIDLFQFTDTTADNLKREIAKIEAISDSPILGYILDLRGNPGGTLRAAIEVSDAFLDRQKSSQPAAASSKITAASSPNLASGSTTSQWWYSLTPGQPAPLKLWQGHYRIMIGRH